MPTNSGYTNSEISAMQRDAIRRVNEMQRISQEKLRQTHQAFSAPQNAPRPSEPPPHSGNAAFGQGSSIPVHHTASPSGSSPPSFPLPDHRVDTPQLSPHPPHPPEHHEEPHPVPRPEGGEPESIFKGILQRLNLDSESIMLLLLTLLLVNEGADSKLIMALVYILL